MALNQPVHLSWPLSLIMQNGEKAGTAATGERIPRARARCRAHSQRLNGSRSPQAQEGGPVAMGLVGEQHRG